MFSWAIFTSYRIIKINNNIQILRKKDDNRYMYNLIFEMGDEKNENGFLTAYNNCHEFNKCSCLCK